MAVTDKARGALKSLSTQEGHKTFVIEDNVGGRFSVLTPVGILPIVLAGFDMNAMLQGALEMEELCAKKCECNPMPHTKRRLLMPWLQHALALTVM